jgi:Tol biopolymer transport system component
MNLWRVAIDERTGKPLGKPIPITTPAPFLAHISIGRDGKTLVYSSTLIRQNIQKMTLDPDAMTVIGEPFDVTTGTRLWSSPDPSADGTSVVFYSRGQPEGDLYVSRADGTGFRQVTTDAAVDRVPRWSPDGAWIAAFSDRSDPLQIWKVRPDGSGLQQVSAAPGDVAMPVWSPDGKRMAISSVPEAKGGTTFVFDPHVPWSEQKAEVLPPLRGKTEFVVNSWSRDGTRLAGQEGFSQGIVVYDLRTRRYERMTESGEWPDWLPDHRHILFVSGGKKFQVVDTRTKSIREIYSVQRHVIGPPRLTADGRAAFYSRRSTEGDIWMATLQADE